MLEEELEAAGSGSPVIGQISQLTEVPPFVPVHQVVGKNVLDSQKPKTEDHKPLVIYDADARNRFEYEVEGGSEIAHVFGPLSDERYMQWNRDLKVRGNEDDVSEEAREASVKLYDDLIIEVENIEYPEGSDWKSLLDSQYKIDALNDLLAVAIVEAEPEKGGKLQLGTPEAAAQQTITTECYFNGAIVQQTHVLVKRTFEFEKKYDRIQAKRTKQQKIGGLRRRQANVEYVPQDDKLGGLYDEMFVSADGFANGRVPMRFKVLVMHNIFGPKSKAKNLGK